MKERTPGEKYANMVTNEFATNNLRILLMEVYNAGFSEGYDSAWSEINNIDKPSE